MGRPFIWEMREGQEEGKKKKKSGNPSSSGRRRRRRRRPGGLQIANAGCATVATDARTSGRGLDPARDDRGRACVDRRRRCRRRRLRRPHSSRNDFLSLRSSNRSTAS